MSVRATTSILWCGFTLSAAIGAFSQLNPNAQFVGSLTQPLCIVAYAFALYYWLKIAADHPRASTMRMAWLLLAWSSAFSMLRHGFEWMGYLTGFFQTMPTTLAGMRQIPIVVSILFLMAGLIAIWSSFSAIGLGVHFRRTDLLWVAVIIALVPLTLSVRDTLNDAGSAYIVIRHLQSASPILLAAPALVGIVLYRICQEMGGGQLAIALRLMVAFLVVRLFVLLLLHVPAIENIPTILALVQAAGWSAPWLFPLAAVKRWNLTISVDALIERYETNQDEEIAGLIRSTK